MTFSLYGNQDVCRFQVDARVLVTSHLNEHLPQGDEGRAELSQKQAADKEIPLVLPEELRNRQTQAWGKLRKLTFEQFVKQPLVQKYILNKVIFNHS